MSAVLLIDDDAPLRTTLEGHLRRREYEVLHAGDGRSGLDVYERSRPEVVLLDLELPGVSGLQVLEILKHRHPEAVVVVLTGHNDVSAAVHAMQLGAHDFLVKPFVPAQLAGVVQGAVERARLVREARTQAVLSAAPDLLARVRESLGSDELSSYVARLAAGTLPVLLQGETGCGKGWLASLLHKLSPRAAGPFMDINCAGLSATFLDSELFGHEKGAFTDAKTAKPGLFEIADGGTLFLDEIGDLAPELQPKLLKVLESRTFRRLGGTREITVDVRIIAATHRDLSAAVAAGTFRQDLYYRLAVFPLRMPPLRERSRETIAALAARTTAELQVGRPGPAVTLSADALRHLTQYPWPGNVRELRNALERALLLAGEAPEIRPEHLPPELRPCRPLVVDDLTDDLSLRGAERRHILRVLRHCDFNRARTARELGITRVTLYKKLRDYDLEAQGR